MDETKQQNQSKNYFFFQKFPLKIDSERKKKKNSGTTE